MFPCEATPLLPYTAPTKVKKYVVPYTSTEGARGFLNRRNADCACLSYASSLTVIPGRTYPRPLVSLGTRTSFPDGSRLFAVRQGYRIPPSKRKAISPPPITVPRFTKKTKRKVRKSSFCVTPRSFGLRGNPYTTSCCPLLAGG